MMAYRDLLVLLFLCFAGAQQHGDDDDDDDWVALANGGIVHHDEKRYAEALDAFDRALISQPLSGELWHNRASSSFRLGRWTEAVDGYTLAAAHMKAHEKYAARVHTQDALYRDAIVSVASSVRAGAFSSIATILAHHLHRPEEAVVFLERAIDEGGEGKWAEGTNSQGVRPGAGRNKKCNNRKYLL